MSGACEEASRTATAEDVRSPWPRIRTWTSASLPVVDRSVQPHAAAPDESMMPCSRAAVEPGRAAEGHSSRPKGSVMTWTRHGGTAPRGRLLDRVRPDRPDRPGRRRPRHRDDRPGPGVPHRRARRPEGVRDVLVDTLLNPGEPIPADAAVLMYQAPCRDDAAEAGRRLVIKRVPGSGRARSCRAVSTKWRGRLSYRWSKVTLFVTAGGVAARAACQLRGSGSRCGGDGQMPPAGGQRGAARGWSPTWSVP